MKKFLLIDFGASRVKTASVDIETGIFSNILNQAALNNISQVKSYYEISLRDIREQFLNICDLYYNKLNIQFDGIVICSQMHGFIVIDKDDKPVSEYISWKDERSLENINGESTYSLVQKNLGDKFKSITGMKLRPTFPFINFLHLCRANSVPSQSKIISIAEWIAMSCGEYTNKTHKTMLAGLGVYDIKKGIVSEEIVELLKNVTGNTFSVNTLGSETEVSGYWKFNNKKIPIFCGIGDHQCALLGAGNIPNKTISINLGTGSQVSVIDLNCTDIDSMIEQRPYFGKSILHTITHIPSGRILSVYINMFETFTETYGLKKIDFWKILDELTASEIMNSDLEFDLALFNSAFNYKGGGKIVNIKEDNFNIKNYFSSLIRCFIFQYLDLLKIFDKEKIINKCILSGGVSKRLSKLSDIIRKEFGYEVIDATSIDETFLGLRTVAVMCSKKIENYLESQNIFAREINVK